MTFNGQKNMKIMHNFLVNYDFIDSQKSNRFIS